MLARFMLSCAFGARSGAIGCRLAARGQLRKLEGLGKDGWASVPGAESRSRRCRCGCGCKCSTRPTIESSKQARTRHAGGLATSLADLAQCYQSALRTIQASIRGSVGQHGNFVTPAQGKLFGEGQFVPRSSGCGPGVRLQRWTGIKQFGGCLRAAEGLSGLLN